MKGRYLQVTFRKGSRSRPTCICRREERSDPNLIPKPLILFWVAIAPSIAGAGCAADRGQEPESTTAELRELFRIGTIDGPEEYTFGEIATFTVGPSAEIYIAEMRGGIRKFDADGEFVQRIAADGEGPGEVDYVVGMAVSKGGELAVVDFGNERISIWSRNGEFERQLRRPWGRPRYGRDAIRYDDAGELWVGLHPPRSGPVRAVGRSACDLRPRHGRWRGARYHIPSFGRMGGLCASRRPLRIRLLGRCPLAVRPHGSVGPWAGWYPGIGVLGQLRIRDRTTRGKQDNSDTQPVGSRADDVRCARLLDWYSSAWTRSDSCDETSFPESMGDRKRLDVGVARPSRHEREVLGGVTRPRRTCIHVGLLLTHGRL